jgi:hypothetical protein
VSRPGSASDSVGMRDFCLLKNMGCGSFCI